MSSKRKRDKKRDESAEPEDEGRLDLPSARDREAERAEDEDTARLIVRAQAGDERAMATVYQRYFDRVFTYLRVALEDEHEAEDSAQDVFVKVLEGLPKYEQRRQPFRAWLFTIARNDALDKLRKLGRVVVEDPEQIRIRQERAQAAGAGAEDEEPPFALNWITDPDLLMFVERLPLAQRQVLVLRYLLDLSNTQTAEALDRSTDEAKVLHHRATKFLRDRLIALSRGAPDDRGGDDSAMKRRFRQQGVLRARRWVLK